MKRLFGTCLLLAGLSGCISFTLPSARENTEATKPIIVPPIVPETAAGSASTPTLPTVASGTARPERQDQPAPAGSDRHKVESALARLDGANGAAARTVAQPAAVASREAPTPAGPQPATAPRASATPAPTPALATGNLQPPAPLQLPVIVTSRGERVPEKPIVPASATGSASENAQLASHAETVKPGQPAPAVKNPTPAETKPGKPSAPLVRLANTKRIALNFEVKDVGPSGPPGVELWCMQNGKEWKKYDAPAQAQPNVIEVDDEGMYGFTLLAKSGPGVTKEPPAAGDPPQVWVIVDLTKPEVQLTQVTTVTSGKSQHVTINWKASDKNLGRLPITLWYAEKEDGPWKVIAGNVENTGKYDWQPPTDLARVLVKVEVSDLAGNVGKAQWTAPVMLVDARPSVSIVGVDAAPGK